MTADALVFHEAFITRLGDKQIDLNNDDIRVALFTSSSNAGDASISNYASLTNEVANGNGYTTGGYVLTAESWADGSPQGQPTFDCDDPTWTASGADITFRWAVVYDNTDTNKTIIGHILVDNTPADYTISDGNTLTLQINASGLFQGSS